MTDNKLHKILLRQSGAIPKGQIFSKLLELMNSILKDIFYYYSRLYPNIELRSLSSFRNNYLELPAVQNSPALPYVMS